MHRTTIAFGAFALALGVVIGVVGVKLASDHGQSLTASAKKVTTEVAVERRNLAVTEELSGELATSVEQDLTTIGQGTITQAGTVGTTLTPGTVIARVDDQPTVLMLGAQPVYRSFQVGMTDGPDVAQLKLNLKSLGFDPSGMVIDNKYSSATAAAVTAWEHSLGIVGADGVVPGGEVIFAPESVQVTAATAAGSRVTPGSSLVKVRPVGGEGLHLTFTVTQSADRYQTGKPVAIVTTDGTSHPAKISSLERAASTGGGGGGGGSTSFTATAIPDSGNGLAPGPVKVDIPTELADNVLAVPSRALVAVVEGGQAVQLAGGNRLVPVQLGVFADGWVQVTGADIKEGEKVVVPS